MKKLKQHYLKGVDKIKLFYSARRKQKVTLTVLVLVLLLGLGTVGLVAIQKASVEPKPDVIEVVPKDDKDESNKDESDKGESDKGESDKGEPDKDEPDKDEPDKGESNKDVPVAEPDPPKAETPKAETPKPTPAPKPQPPKPQPPAHTHTWVPQYKNHPAQAAKGYYDYVPPVVEKTQYVYFGDGHKIKASDLPSADYMDRYTADHKTNWWTGYETVTLKEGYEVWVETSPAKAAWRELTHYVCQTDGATKQP